MQHRPWIAYDHLLPKVPNLSSLPNFIDRHGWGPWFEIWIGAYGATRFMVRADHICDALDWVADDPRVSGYFTDGSELGPDDMDDDGYPVDHTCCGNSGVWIPSWEWGGVELSYGPDALQGAIDCPILLDKRAISIFTGKGASRLNEHGRPCGNVD